MKALFYALAVLSLTACGPSKEKITTASAQCEKYVSENMKSVNATKVFDVWEKHDALVVEVGYQRGSDTGDMYTTRKCVYDEKNGTIAIPALVDRQWDKH